MLFSCVCRCDVRGAGIAPSTRPACLTPYLYGRCSRKLKFPNRAIRLGSVRLCATARSTACGVRLGGANRKRFRIRPCCRRRAVVFSIRLRRSNYAELTATVRRERSGPIRGSRARRSARGRRGRCGSRTGRIRAGSKHVGSPSSSRSTACSSCITKPVRSRVRAARPYSVPSARYQIQGVRRVVHPTGWRGNDPMIATRTDRHAPNVNKRHGRKRYGFGQPAVFYRDGRFVMHYIDSCTGGRFYAHFEADNRISAARGRSRVACAVVRAASTAGAGCALRAGMTSSVRRLAPCWSSPAYGTAM